MTRSPWRLTVMALALGIALIPACRSVYYDTWEFFGQEKRDLLKSALGKLVGEQQEAKESFGTALERVKLLSGFRGGDLEAEYDKLKAAAADAHASATAIDSRIEDIDTTADDLFAEWQAELDTMQTASLRGESERKLRETRSRFDTMQRSMVSSRRKMDPPLQLLDDHVLFLKHNLNAAAIGSLAGSMRQVEDSIRSLQTSIEESIREAQSFLESMPE